MVIALPSLDGIKRAVEMKLGVALLPRRCAITEIASGRLVAVPVAGISRRRQLTLVCRKAHRSHAANAFLAVAQEKTREASERHEDTTGIEGSRQRAKLVVSLESVEALCGRV